MELGFNEEERMILETVRDFVQEQLRPIARELDANAEVPLEIVRGMQEMGLFALLIPEEYGGSRVSTCCYAAVIEEISKVCGAVAIILSVHNSVGAFPILRFGREDQKQAYLPMLANEWIGAFSLTEPGAGSDAARLSLKAERLDGYGRVLPDDAPVDAVARYRLNGTKIFVTNGSIADLFLVMGRTAESAAAPHRGVTAFLLEKGTPGFEVGKHEEKMGLRASDLVELIFTDCEVEATQRLGAEGEGFKIAMMALDGGRIGIASQAIGIATAALEEATEYARQRKQFGKPIGDFQAIQWMLADSKVELDAARLLALRAAQLKENGKPFSSEAAMAKLYASEAANRICNRVVQIHGGYGFVRDFPAERHLRDVRVTTIYEGTSEIQRTVIARSALR